VDNSNTSNTCDDTRSIQPHRNGSLSSVGGKSKRTEEIQVLEESSSACCTSPSSNQFNFLCSMPYTSEGEFDSTIDKISTMYHLNDGIARSAHVPTRTSQYLESNNNNINIGSSNKYDNNNNNDFCPSQTDILAENTNINVQHSDTTHNHHQQQYIVSNSHHDNVILSYPPPHSSPHPPHRITKAEIPSGVRNTLSFSISQQREGGESLESEQMRRLQEFTLFRRAIMHTHRANVAANAQSS
jgi:hypothetical protein